MAAALFDISELLPAFQQNALILTPNSRLRRKILQAYYARQKELSSDKNTWPSPRVHAVSDWLAECWQVLLDQAQPQCRGAIAQPHQRNLLWKQIISESELGAQLLRPEQLANNADTAYRHLELWQLSLSESVLNNSERNDFSEDLDYHHFRLWALDFQQRLEKQLLLTQESAYQIIVEAFASGVLPQENTLYLQGFDDIPPLHQSLFKQAGQHLVSLSSPATESAQILRVEAENLEAECYAAARWSADIIKRDADTSIAIIVPNLGRCRDLVERCLTETFEPQSLLPDCPRYTLPFNFSAGVPLSSTPLICDTLQLLNFTKERWELNTLCNILQSPFFGDADGELVLRTELCARLRALGKRQIRGADVRYYCQQLTEKLSVNLSAADQSTAELSTAKKSIDNHDKSLSQRLQEVEAQLRQAPSRNSAQHWAGFLQQQLNLLGWPGTRRLDSQEYQQAHQWQQLLERFSELDATGCRLTLTEALSELYKLAASTHFQAQTPDSPIQVLGALESAGLKFNHCWVLGLHRRDWPPSPKPNPLLPLSLQREHQMPHASAERELHFAQALTLGYSQCASNVIFSSPQRDEQTPLHPSALITDIPLSALSELVPDSRSATQLYQQEQQQQALEQLTVVDCSQGPELAIDDGQVVRGGSNILRDQGSCPFTAFAVHRLGAREALPPSSGLSPIERGTLLHEALAIIWNQLQNSANLQRCDDEELNTLIQSACTDALAPWQQRRPDQLGPVYCQLERERLTILLTRWLNIEKMRPPFTVVGIEQDCQIHFAGLDLKLRLDRVDRLDTVEDEGESEGKSEAQYLLVDYKTGKSDIKKWQGERPDEPQLPLYALTSTTPVNALAFAQINAKAIKFEGLGELHSPIEGVVSADAHRLDLPREWSEIKTHWQATLQHLAEDFIRGDARVDFKNKIVQEYSAELSPLNRIAEQQSIEDFLARLNHHSELEL